MTYNSDGWLKTEQDPYSTYSMSYDADGQLAVVDNNGTPGAPRLILTLTYDGLGNRTGLTDNYGGSISYLYDNDSNRTWESMTVSGTQGHQTQCWQTHRLCRLGRAAYNRRPGAAAARGMVPRTSDHGPWRCPMRPRTEAVPPRAHSIPKRARCSKSFGRSYRQALVKKP